MKGELKYLKDNDMPIRAASRKWGIPTTTLSKWLGGLITTSKKGPPTILMCYEEDLIVEWCKEMASVGHGLQIANLKVEVTQIGQSRPNPFTNGLLGKSWWLGFKCRHPKLTLHTTEGLHKDEALNLRLAIVFSFYEILLKAYSTNPYGSAHLWNYDETGIQAGKNGAMGVLDRRGSMSVSYIIPKKLEWNTILCCVNSLGKSIPGFYLFKGKPQLQNYISKCDLMLAW
ncbi:uncharacterized protein LOC131876246 [Cryptomeria japonica]|uniref:uncharacterized protein LOC131876246 n=1 Tax=Cryptomeria japonica TaxID=3369 RepID=UPI0027D9CFE7|nr:uncharacterized protein LOC131876246 [Cryptomeria japonica]